MKEKRKNISNNDFEAIEKEIPSSQDAWTEPESLKKLAEKNFSANKGERPSPDISPL